jgi:hypothetical protein
MKKIRKWLLKVSITGVVFFIPVITFAQGEPGCDPGCSCRLDHSFCPIDNGVWVLLSIGILYGIKKIRDARKNAIPAP